jgi:hypothetical protein
MIVRIFSNCIHDASQWGWTWRVLSRTATAYHRLEDMQRQATSKHVRLIVTEGVVQRVVTVARSYTVQRSTRGKCWLPTTPPPITHRARL